MKRIMILLLCFLLVGCSESKVSGTYMKICGPYTGYSTPQVMEYHIKDNKIQRYITITYAKDTNELDSLLTIPIRLVCEEFGKDAITVDRSFDKNEQMYVGTITVDYSKIDYALQNAYNVENKTMSITTVDDIVDFSNYEKMDN